MINESRKRVIWIVDDSATDSARSSAVLGDDYTLRLFPDGASAVEKLASSELPDLMLVDWVMPGLSGIEVCQFVRSSPGKIAQVPIILLTAQHGSNEIVEAFGSGANDYIPKPFVDQELKARVRTMIATKTFLERAENAEADVRSLLSNAPDPIFAVDANGLITFANTAAVDAIAESNCETDLRSSLVGQRLNALLPNLDFKNVLRGPGQALMPLADIVLGERVFSPSLRYLPSDNSVTSTISLRDVTERRNADARRLDFYSIIAHDLRTPITSALMRLQFALRGKHGVLPAGLTLDLQRMESGLKSQVAMVNDFLELAKLEGTGYKIERERINMSELILQTMEDFQPLLDKNAQKWIHVAPENAHCALGDSKRIAQVLANLIGNAIKFTPAAGTITTRIELIEGLVQTSVSDTGRGIAQHELPQLFDRFTRAKESASDVVGSGLGLMIVREIINAHQGTVGVNSHLGEGSEFWFRLPACHADENENEHLRSS